MLVQDVYSNTPGTGGVDGIEGKLREVISNIIISIAELRRQVNTFQSSSADLKPVLEEGEEPSGKPVLHD